MANNISFNAPTVVNDVLYPKIVYNTTLTVAGSSTNVPFAQNEIAPFSMIAVSGTVRRLEGSQSNSNLYLLFQGGNFTVFIYSYGTGISTDMSFYAVVSVSRWTTGEVGLTFEQNYIAPDITWNQYNRFKFNTTPSLRANYLTGTVNIKFIQF